MANVDNLPRYLQKAVRDFGVEMAQYEAFCVVRTTRLEGNVGPEPPCLGALVRGDATIRIDCFHNPEFWMEYDVSTGSVRGRVPGWLRHDGQAMRSAVGGEFLVARADNGCLRFTHTCNPGFWVELGY